MTIKIETRLSRSENFLSSELQDEIVMMDLTQGSYFSLQGPAVRLWELLEDEVDVATMRNALVEEYDVSPDQCEKELLHILNDMNERGLVNIATS